MGITTQRLQTEAKAAPSQHSGSSPSAALESMRSRVIEQTARELANQGFTQIALFGAGRHTRPILRQPWVRFGITVCMILDDNPPRDSIQGVPILRADSVDPQDMADAIVISSEDYEQIMYDRASELYGTSGVPIVRIYNPEGDVYSDEHTVARLSSASGLSDADARWLVENRSERHDATLDMLPPARTELHLRRYELARATLDELNGTVVADLACGTGYGASVLSENESVQYVGVDIDARAIDYASRRFGAQNRQYVCASATNTPIEDDHADLVVSFETIEHIEDTTRLIEEYARTLKDTGLLIISTPNKLGPTPHHVHDLDRESFIEALSAHFEIQELIGQLPNDCLYDTSLPPGMWYLNSDDSASHDDMRPDYLIAIAKLRGTNVRRFIGAGESDTASVQTRHGLIHFFCPNDTVRWRAETLLTKEPETIDWIDQFVVGDVYWDIGASTGPYVMYALAAGRAGKIFAFEPSPWNWWVLSEQVRRSSAGDVVCTLPIAVGEHPKADVLHMRHPMPGGAGSSFGQPQGEFGEVFTPAFSQGAIGIPIDDLIERYGIAQPNRIKVDVDGNEIGILRGASRTLANDQLKSVLVELDDSRSELIQQVTDLMHDAGLELTHKLHAPDIDGTDNQSIFNFVFMRKE